MNFHAYTLSEYPDWACITAKADDSQTRVPVHLCCIIDTSGSMDYSYKLDNVKHSLKYLIDFLGENDRISIITFNQNAETVINKIDVSSSKKDGIRASISLIHSEGCTNISDAILKARETLLGDISSHNGVIQKQGILLLTDGIPNVGLVKDDEILEVAKNTLNMFPGTSISCVGYGTDHNVKLLQDISNMGGSPYYVVNNLEDVAVVFGDILGGFVSCVAQKVRIILPLNTQIKSRYAVLTTDNAIEVLIGDIPDGMESAILAKIPKNTIVVLKGYNLINNTSFQYNITVQSTDDVTIQTNCMAHYLRFKVVNILDKTTDLLTQAISNEMIHKYVDKIEKYLSNIETCKQNGGHSLWSVLIQELNRCKDNLLNYNNISENTRQLMRQHSNYLGTMRGIAANIPNECFMDELPPPIQITHRIFSNITQRAISEQLHTSVSPLIIRQCGYNSRQSSGIKSPITLSPQLNSISGIAIPPPHMSLSSRISLPPPNFPLVRQVAAPNNGVCI